MIKINVLAMKQFFVSFIFLIAAISGMSQTNTSMVFAHDFLDVNNINANINSNGHLFWRKSDTVNYILGYEFPKGSGKHTMFNSTIWIGGMDEDDSLRLAAELYNNEGNDFWNGPLSFMNGSIDCSEETATQWNRVWKLSKQEINFHIQHFGDENYSPIESIATWPAHGEAEKHQAEMLAPFVDVDNNGIYQPMNGDYPLIKGDQSIFFIFNDYRLHTETQGKPIGLEIHAMVYAFNRSENPSMNNSIFVNYKIYNRSNIELHDAYLGAFADIDIGGWDDDYFATDVGNGAIYCYNDDAFDEDAGISLGYGDNPPSQAVMLLAGPLMDDNQMDDQSGNCDESINGLGFGDEIIDNERLGMTASMRIYESIFWQGCPILAPHYYNLLNSKYKSGDTIFWPCEDSSNLVPLKFWYPGGTDICNWGVAGNDCQNYNIWSELNSNNDWPFPQNRFGLAISGPFTFKANSVENLDLAFVAARDFSDTSSVDLLKEYMAEIRSEFTANPDGFGDYYLGVEEQNTMLESVEIFPNPTNKTLNVKFKTGTDLWFSILDIRGCEIKSGQLTNNQIQVDDLNSGLYFLLLKSEKWTHTFKFIRK